MIPFFIGFIFGAKICERTSLSSSVEVNFNGKGHHHNQFYWPLKKHTKYLMWLGIFITYLVEIFNTIPYLHGRPYDPTWSAIWFPLNRAIWSLMLTSIIWLCLTNNGGIVGRVLCWPGFRPLSRLTYSVYLTHAWILWIALGTRRDLIDPSGRSFIVLFGGVLVSAYILGFVFTVVFESPLFHLMDYVKRRTGDRGDDKEETKKRRSLMFETPKTMPPTIAKQQSTLLDSRLTDILIVEPTMMMMTPTSALTIEDNDLVFNNNTNNETKNYHINDDKDLNICWNSNVIKIS